MNVKHLLAERLYRLSHAVADVNMADEASRRHVLWALRNMREDARTWHRSGALRGPFYGTLIAACDAFQCATHRAERGRLNSSVLKAYEARKLVLHARQEILKKPFLVLDP